MGWRAESPSYARASPDSRLTQPHLLRRGRPRGRRLHGQRSIHRRYGGLPEPGVTIFRCILELTNLPRGYVGELLTTSSAASRQLIGAASDPPGYVHPSITTCTYGSSGAVCLRHPDADAHDDDRRVTSGRCCQKLDRAGRVRLSEPHATFATKSPRQPLIAATLRLAGLARAASGGSVGWVAPYDVDPPRDNRSNPRQSEVSVGLRL